MLRYNPPLQDIDFIYCDLFKAFERIREFSEEFDMETYQMMNTEFSKFATKTLLPLYQLGDQGCKWDGSQVYTPEGFKNAYELFVQAGWQRLPHAPEFGGLGLPVSYDVIRGEILGAANWPWSMYAGLTLGAIFTLSNYGSDELKQKYLVKLVSAEWSGTMCLTEPHCGTDLGLIKTKAEPQIDGSYSLSGTKIFISGGDQDITSNIIHLVLARVAGGPKGTKGLSLFLVPKVNDDGERNGVNCIGLEKKMGIHGISTCTMSFEGSKAYLVGPEHKGLQCMFMFMNVSRIGAATQGLAAMELAYQNALAYAKERKSMRALGGVRNADQDADYIIHHGDVQRMLLTQKAFLEGSRALIYYSNQFSDLLFNGKTQKDKDDADNILGFLTPILKAFITEVACECTNLGIQVFGGHGYIKETGMEQIARDTRISTIYEGTTGVQSLDLLGRKVLLEKGETLKRFSTEIGAYCRGRSAYVTAKNRSDMQKHIRSLRMANWKWLGLAARIGLKASKDRDEVNASAYHFLMYSGYVLLGYMWLLQSEKAKDLVIKRDTSPLISSKPKTANFYFSHIFPRAKHHYTAALSGNSALKEYSIEEF